MESVFGLPIRDTYTVGTIFHVSMYFSTYIGSNCAGRNLLFVARAFLFYIDANAKITWKHGKWLTNAVKSQSDMESTGKAHGNKNIFGLPMRKTRRIHMESAEWG